jgi:hypothetical protein
MGEDEMSQIITGLIIGVPLIALICYFASYSKKFSKALKQLDADYNELMKEKQEKLKMEFKGFKIDCDVVYKILPDCNHFENKKIIMDKPCNINKSKYDFTNGDFICFNNRYFKVKRIFEDRYILGENINGVVELVVIRDEYKIEKWIPKINDKIQVKRLIPRFDMPVINTAEIINIDRLNSRNRLMVMMDKKELGVTKGIISILNLNSKGIDIFPIESKEAEITSASDIEYFVKKYLENPTGKTYDQLTTIIDCHFVENCIKK